MQDTVALGAYPAPPLYVSGEARSIEWWERRLFLLPLLILLSAIGQFVGPMLPDLYPGVVLAHLCALSFAWYVYWRISKVLPRTDTTSSGRPRRTIPGLIVVPSFLLFQATPYLLFQQLYTLKDTSFAHTVVALVTSIPITLIWPSKVAAYERFTAKRRNFALIIFSMLLTFFAIYAATLFGMPQLLKGSPAPWPTLLAFAQREAQKVDKAAVLTRIMTQDNTFLFPSSDSSLPLRASFYFDANGSEIEVDLLDSNPPRLLVTRGSGGRGDPVEPAEAELLNNRLANITFGPRDLYIQTEAEARRHGIELHSAPPISYVTVSLYPGTDFSSLRGAETVWHISYIYKTPTGLSSLWIYADAATGEILQREEH